MKIQDYYAEFMKQNFEDAKGKNYTPYVFMLFLQSKNFYFQDLPLMDLVSFVYRFYRDNLNYGSTNGNIYIANISKYMPYQIRNYVLDQLLLWQKNGNGVFCFNDNHLFVNDSFSDMSESEKTMLTKVLESISLRNFKSIVKYSDKLESSLSSLAVGVVPFEQYCQSVNSTHFKARAFECSDYCVCCEETRKEQLQAVHLVFEPHLMCNPNNSIILCKTHAKLYYEGKFYFDEYGKIVILEQDVDLDKRMHLALGLVKQKKEFLGICRK